MKWILIDTYPHSVQSRVCETAGRPSVFPVIRPPHPAVVGLLLWARRAGDIDRLLLHDRRAAATASSVALSADVGS